MSMHQLDVPLLGHWHMHIIVMKLMQNELLCGLWGAYSSHVCSYRDKINWPGEQTLQIVYP